MPVAQRITAEEFVASPVPEHGRPWNLIDGEVVVSESTRLHARIQRNLLVALNDWTHAAPGRGSAELPADIEVDEWNVFVPDVLWYSAERLPSEYLSAPYPMPTLAVEIRSPSAWRYDVGAKRSGYERYGLPELWLVDTVARTVLVYRRSAAHVPRFDVALELTEEEKLASPLLPDFALTVADVFEVRTVGA